MLWFREDSQKEVILTYLPRGRANKQAYNKDTNYSRLLDWFASMFFDLTQKYIQTFKQMFICTAYDIDSYKRDYSMPNETFYSTDNEEHRKDIYVMKYLMKGNTDWHFQAIANIYDIDVKVYAGRDYFRQDGFPYKFPLKFGKRMTDDSVLVIIFKYDKKNGFPYKFPIRFTSNRKIDKIKKIYKIIKSSEVKIIYLQDDTITNERINLCVD